MKKKHPLLVWFIILLNYVPVAEVSFADWKGPGCLLPVCKPITIALQFNLWCCVPSGEGALGAIFRVFGMTRPSRDITPTSLSLTTTPLRLVWLNLQVLLLLLTFFVTRRQPWIVQSLVHKISPSESRDNYILLFDRLHYYIEISIFWILTRKETKRKDILGPDFCRFWTQKFKTWFQHTS